jgi:hypothetical protein
MAIFLIIAPLLLLYSAGWRYDINRQVVEKVGGVVIESEPRGADVYVNNKPLNKKTPCTINNLLPKNYTITLKKGGYLPWSKSLTVEPGITNRLTSINLLRDPDPMAPRLADPFPAVNFSPVATHAAYVQKKSVILIDVAAGQVLYSQNQPDDVVDFYWSPAGDQAIFKSSHEKYFLVTLADLPLIQDLSSLFAPNIDRTYWSQTEDDIIYTSSSDGFYRINTFQKTVTRLSPDAHVTFSADGLLFSEYANRADIITDAGSIKNQIPLLEGHRLTYSGPYNNTVMILDTQHQFLYDYNINSNAFRKLPQAVGQIKWNHKTNTLLFYNDFEIWSWDMQKDQQDLILRTSDKIKEATWLKNAAYLAYTQQSGAIKIIETAGPDRNNYELPISAVTQIVSNQAGDLLTILADQKIYSISL